MFGHFFNITLARVDPANYCNKIILFGYISEFIPIRCISGVYFAFWECSPYGVGEGGLLPNRMRWKILLGENFFILWWESDVEWFWQLEPFSSLKRTFCKYWTSIKIKIRIICVYNKYKVKVKTVKEQWLQLKMKFLLDYNMKFVI